MGFNPLIIQEAYAALKLGYPTSINLNTIRAFTAKVGADIAFGSVLIRTTALKVYEAAENVAVAITDANQVMGINESTNVKLNATYPGGAAVVDVQGGQQGNNMESGEIAVEYVGTAPSVENSPVYLVTVIGDQPAATLGKLTIGATGTQTVVLLPQFKWTGLIDSNLGLAVVKKLY